MKNDTRTWKITLLTPLHIGSGDKLQIKLDYIKSGTELQVIDLEAAIRGLEDNVQAISEIGRQEFDLERFIRTYKIPKQVLYSLPFHKQEPPKEIHRFIKNAYGQPYIPGSSLKGAIRTALWTTLRRPDHLSPNNYGKFAEAIKNVQGSDSYHDFLRPLQISDSEGMDPNAALSGEEIKFFNVGRENQAGWKDFTRRHTVNTYQNATGVYVEILHSGLTFYVHAGINPLLRSSPIKDVYKIPQCQGLASFESLAKTVNAHSQKIAESERRFFSRFGPATAPAAEFYQQLLRKIDTLSSQPGSFIVRLSWGSGWRGMTGDWLSDDELEIVRKKKSLGKTGCPKCHSTSKWDKRVQKQVCQTPNCKHQFDNDEKWLYPVFPKTRRLAMKDGVPCLPLGWVEVNLADNYRFRQQVPIVSASETPQVTHPAIPAKPVDPAAVRMEKLSEFQSLVNSCKNPAGEIGTFLQKIRMQADKELQTEMCRILVQGAESMGKKFSKGLKEGKTWAKDLDSLCREHGVSTGGDT